ncbi:MAG: TSUP family transporter [Succinivibrionaceae bacterium]|nr:TSUP family transporter [Succinivibrionaceae bacterium]
MFTPDLTTFLIACPAVFLAGFVDAIAGGGGLISLPGYIIGGLPAHLAITTNKLSSTLGTALATWRFARSGYIKWRFALTCSAAAFVGSCLGARCVLLVDERALLILLLLVLPATAWYIFRHKDFGATAREEAHGPRTMALALAISLGIGAYDGFYGPGTGTFLIIALTSVASVRLDRANGIAKVINLTTNIAALTVFLIEGQILILLGLVAGAFSIAGNLLGASYFKHRGAAAVRPLIMVVIAIFLAKVVWDLTH